MKRYSVTKIVSALLILSMALAALAGCGPEKPAESTPSVTTPIVTPEATTPEATPVATTPEATTPAATTPEATTPTETPVATTPVETPPASEPLVDYNISYDLDGGVDGGNPTKYNKESEIAIKIPYKEGYSFLGWTVNGGSETQLNAKIVKGTEGDLTFKAVWAEKTTTEAPKPELDKTHFGKDDGITENPNGCPVSEHDMVGGRGEGVYVVKTVYTEILSDGVKDAAYSYGVHWYGNTPNNHVKEYYANRGTGYDIYMVRGQEGRIHVFVEVTDPDVVVNGTLWNHKQFHTDSVDVYVDLGNWGSTSSIVCVVADPTNTYKYGLSGTRVRPDDFGVTITDKGYNVEFSFDNDGLYFDENDEVGLGFYLNDANEYKSLDSYKKYTLRHGNLLKPASEGYFDPDPKKHDVIQVSLDSATGNVDLGKVTPEKTGDVLVDLLSGAASGIIVIDEKVTVQTITLAQGLTRYLRTNGANIVYSYENDIPDSASYDIEILLGMTDRELTLNTINSINYNDVALAFNGEAIALIGWNEESAVKAGDLFYTLLDFIKNGGKSESVGSIYKYSVDGLVGNAVPVLDGFEYVTDVGEGAYLIYKLKATMDEYTAYVAKLEAAGFKKHTDNQMNRVVVSTYYNDDTVVNVQFANGDTSGFNVATADTSLRVVVEPLANTALPATTAPEDANATVTVSSVSQLSKTNLCLVFQLSNGHFVIVDSGENGNQKAISDFIRSKAPDKNKVVVDAWFFTHFHQDHIGGFVDYMGVSSLLRYVTVNNIIYNFPQKQVLDTAPGAVDQTNIAKWHTCLEKSGATVYQARTGQKYYFGNSEIEILWTFEDIMPFNVTTDSTNRTCIGFSVTIAGQKIMVTGDSTEEEFRAAANMYGDYLKSDILQLSHHGYGNGLGDHNFYKLVNAPVVFHPQKDANYPSSVGANEKWAIENAQLVIRSGNYGNATLELPFTVGDEIVSEKTPTAEKPNSVTQ